MVAKLSRWEAIATVPQILDLDLLGWVWTGSPGAFASAKHRKQHVTFIPDPLDSPKDHSKTSSKENAKFAWLAFHARVLSCSEGLGGPLNSTPHNLSKVHWWMLRKGISGHNMLQPMTDQKPSKTSFFVAVVSGSNVFHYLHSLVIFTLKGLNWKSRSTWSCNMQRSTLMLDPCLPIPPWRSTMI